MVLFGAAEIVTAFNHNFFGVATAPGSISTLAGASIGVAYSLAGLLVLTRRKNAVALALVCLALVVAGRIAVVTTGLFPLGSVKQVFAIVAGTAIAIGFAIYIGRRWRSLS
jgi:hypothetical protein